MKAKTETGTDGRLMVEPKDAAFVLGVGESALSQQRRGKKRVGPKFTQRGGRYLYALADLLAYSEARIEAAKRQHAEVTRRATMIRANATTNTTAS